jgi:methylmalonyl-CoA mutase N-terminal domain/subunit
MTINSPAAVMLALFVAQAEEKGVPRSQLGGTLQNDILKEYQAQKEFVFPPRQSMRLVRDTIQFTAAEMPKWNSISVSGYHIREAGSTAAEELAFTLANGFAYVELANRPVSVSTRSRRDSPSSSTPTSTSSKRSPSTARRGACGRRG